MTETAETLDVIEERDIADVLANSGMLVSFHQSTWTGEATDPKALKTVKDNTGAKGNVGKFRKNLMANNDGPLQDVVRALGAAYRDHMRMTLPWGNSQQRLLPNDGFMDYAKMIQHHKTIINAKLQVFVAGYEDAKQKALADLEGLANPNQYPSAADIASRFSLDVDFDPVPAGASFPGMPKEIGTLLQQRLKAKTAARMKDAIDAMVDDVKKTVRQFANQSRPEGRIHDTTVEKLLALPATIRRFNLMGDAKLEAMASLIARELSFFDCKSLEGKNTRAAANAAALKVEGMLG